MTSGLIITEVNVTPLKALTEASPLLGFARIVLNGAFLISGIRIVRVNGGIFLSYPREYHEKSDKAYKVAHPISKEFGDQILKRVLEAYGEAIKV